MRYQTIMNISGAGRFEASDGHMISIEGVKLFSAGTKKPPDMI